MPKNAPIAIAMASAATMPAVEPSQVPIGSSVVASVIGREHRLVAELREEERRPDREQRPASRARRAVLVGVAELVTTQRPGREAEEGEPRDDLDGGRRQGEREHRSQQDGPRVHDEGRDRDGDEDRQRPVARGEGERHQLALVAELGEEHDAEGEEEGVHAGSVR